MPLPAGTASLKIHPAIGFARLSTNHDTFIFGEPHPRAAYKSGDRIKRQAVRYQVFAYDAQNNAIAVLSPAWCAANGIGMVWRVRVANRKTAEAKHDDGYVISASARSDQNGGRLIGRCGDFAGSGQAIELGDIAPDGVFTPPISAVHSRVAGAPIPTGGMYDTDFTDNTSDGVVSVVLTDLASHQPLNQPSLDAWVVVGPQDFAPDLDDQDTNNLELYLTELLLLPNAPPPTPLNGQARALDREVLRRGTAVFSPGIELSLPQGETAREMFHTPASLGDADEVRIRPGSSLGGPGTLPGELTLGLCSPWQFDFRACTCHWWPNHRPDLAFQAPGGPSVNWLRRTAADASPAAAKLTTNEDFIRHVDELGIIRSAAGAAVEHERDNDI
jgi:hypothetical protein